MDTLTKSHYLIYLQDHAVLESDGLYYPEKESVFWELDHSDDDHWLGNRLTDEATIIMSALREFHRELTDAILLAETNDPTTRPTFAHRAILEERLWQHIFPMVYESYQFQIIHY